MKVFVLIFQKPLVIETFTSLSAIFLKYEKDRLEVSKSTLDKHDFSRFKYMNAKIILSKTITQSTGDVKREKTDE